jgi:Tfp pilus assembly protein PilF
MSKPKNMSLQTFLAHFTKDERADRRYCFIIGAGGSKQSGIPTGGELAEIWLREIKDLYPSEYEKWMKEKGIDEKNPAPHYPQIYDKRFEIDPKEGFFALTKTMEGREPSCGYSVLVQILANTRHNVAITTNFDSMIEDSMFTYTQKKPLVCGHESLTGFITPMITRPLIAKIHRDLLYAPKSSSSETNELHESWKKALTNILNIYTPLVIGYGGNDGSLMGFLEAIEKIEGGIFWFFREKDGEPAEKIINLVARHNGYLVPIEGFDEMMLQINSRLGYDLLDGKIIEVAKQRAQRYKDQIENIQKGQAKGSDTAVALKETISKGKRSWWSVELEVAAEKDVEKRDKIYTEGIKEFPQNHELLGNYANFLCDRQDYVKAEQYYKKALELDPTYANATGNYAQLLIITERKEEGRQMIVRAFELKPENTDLLAELWFYRYANFYEENGETAYEELVKLIKAGARSIGWNFKENIELAKKEGHPFIDKLEKLDRIITEDASPNNL